MLAFRIREYFPGTRITEAHPTALLDALKLEKDYQGFAKRYCIRANGKNEHEKDAFVCAVCAKEGFEGRWRTDLALRRQGSEQDPFSYWLAPMHYFWPKQPFGDGPA